MGSVSLSCPSGVPVNEGFILGLCLSGLWLGEGLCLCGVGAILDMPLRLFSPSAPSDPVSLRGEIAPSSLPFSGGGLRSRDSGIAGEFPLLCVSEGEL
ncbi:hypothetical protein GDO81_021157 [Engystomops pustulosus]|uniref:Uncharacterized protein n=1 Tax=Engystomops pustulosus TaxID=76066 RepID=A0AAV6Z7Z6_ENGPU|nr:hypothetical protein GDO81_021157 [Engystomops pustulosus]